MNENMHKTCTICKSVNIENKYVKDGFTICKCNDCGSMFVKEIMSNEELSKYYETLTDEYIYTDANKKFLNFYYLKLKKIIEKMSLNKGKILDIGCSSGFFLDLMTEWDCYGNEISPLHANLAKNKIGEDKIFCGSIDDYPEKKDFFDVITMQDCIDHFVDPTEAIKKAVRMLKPNGLFIVKVHNFDCLWAKLSKDKFFAIIPPYHLHYFTTKSLSSCLIKEGLNINLVKYIPHLLQLKGIFYRFSQVHESSIFYKLYKILDKYSFLGNLPVVKNLNDIVTIVTTKKVN